MSFIFALALVALAETPAVPDRIHDIAGDAKIFMKECLLPAKVADTKGFNITNKTADSMDKKKLADELAKELGLKVKADSTNSIDLVVMSSSSEKNKVRKTTLKTDFKLAQADGATCSRSYSKEVTETRK